MNEGPLLHASVVAEQAARSSRPAIQWASGCLSHAELRESTLRVADQLARSGVGAGQRVALCLPRCPEAVQALLGILASGATYVPIDPALPTERIRATLEDADAALLLTTAQLRDRLGQQAAAVQPPVVCVEETGTGRGLEAWCAAPPSARPSASPGPEAAAILYTSGTTGSPKGVVLSHPNIACFLAWAIHRLELRDDDRFLSHAPLHFDLSTLDVFAPLQLGGALILLDDKTLRFPSAVAQAVERERVTVWYSVPTALRLLLERGGIERRDLSSLRRVLFAGEAFPPATLRSLMERLPGPLYANLYGPTETNVCSYHLLHEPPAPAELALPIGIPCEHVELSIRDEAGQAVDSGELGEICVAGPGVSPGYWRRPELTAATRLADGVTYRTGDLGRIGSGGAVELAGRRDQQVKIRGHRVELLEVENRLASHPEVSQAAALLLGAGELAPSLVVVARPAAGCEPDADALRRYCAEWLPAYAVPRRILVRGALPLTGTGKLDRRQLFREVMAQIDG